MRAIYLLVLIFVFGCKDTIKNEIFSDGLTEKINFGIPDITENSYIITKADLLGYWVGEYNSDLSEKEEDKLLENNEEDVSYNFKKKITFSIDKIEGDKIEGHSIVGGNISPFKGELKELEGFFILTVNEIENKSTDGKFFLNIKTGETDLIGNWNANNKQSVPIYRRKLKLTKKFFKYNSENSLEDSYVDYYKMGKVKYDDDVEDSLGNITKETYEEDSYFTTTDTVTKLNPSTQIFKKELVENLTKGDIYILRNLIFARHGFTFKDKKLRSYFDKHSWYMPIYSDVKKDLTVIEKNNIDLLLRYEQNAIEYYDVFGR
jgi:hypothetical protein